MQEYNIINARFNRFKKNEKTVTKVIKSFKFEKGLKSINYSKLFFTNFAKNSDEEEYNVIMDYYIKYLNGDNSFLLDFFVDELSPDYKTDRLLKIINKVQNTKYENKEITLIFKFNHIKYKGIHFFVRVSRNNYKLVLIDLYHLGIFGVLYDKNGKPTNQTIITNYKSHKHNDIKLDDILELGELEKVV